MNYTVTEYIYQKWPLKNNITKSIGIIKV